MLFTMWETVEAFSGVYEHLNALIADRWVQLCMQTLPEDIFNYVMSKHSRQDQSSATFGCVLHGSGVLVSWAVVS